MRKLVILRAGRQVGEIPVDRAVLSLGRHRANTVTLEDPNISRYHAALMLDAEGSCYVQDVGSKNGTFLNGVRISRIRLKSGDTFKLGSHDCTYLDDGDGEALAVPEHDDEPTHSVALAGLAFPGGDEHFIGTSSAAKDILRKAQKVAQTNVSVLITGESGTGKGVVGKLIHTLSRRAGGPFVAVNCAAIPGELIESELFGHRKGSFTGATADRIGKFQAAEGGTLLLDEVGDMSLAAQAKILRAIEDRHIEQIGNPKPISVDVRVVAATNKDLNAGIKTGTFREDLLFRLTTVSIHVPPLRDRPDDIVLLANWLLARLIEEMPTAHGSYFTSEALDTLLAYRWPGNVRQLRNVVAHAVIMKEAAAIRPQDLGLEPRLGDTVGVGETPTPPLPVARPQEHRLEEVEARHIAAELDRHGWNITRTAAALGIARKTLRERIARYGIRKP